MDEITRYQAMSSDNTNKCQSVCINLRRTARTKYPMAKYVILIDMTEVVHPWHQQGKYLVHAGNIKIGVLTFSLASS